MRTFSIMMGAVLLAGSFSLTRPAAADDADLAKAKANYQSYCQPCHGDDGKGNGPNAAILNPKPRDFTNCADMKKRPDDELLKVINEGGDAIGLSADMQAWGGTLKDDEMKALVKYIRAFCKDK